MGFPNLCSSLSLVCMCFTCLHHRRETFACKVCVAVSEAPAVHLHCSLYRVSLKWTWFSLHLSPLLDFLLRSLKSGYQHLKCGFISNSCSCFANKFRPTHTVSSHEHAHTFQIHGGPQTLGALVEIHVLLLLALLV